MPTLRISSRTQVFGDVAPGQFVEPLQRYVDWEKFASGMPAREAISDRKVVAPGQTLSLANVTVTTGIAAGARYSLGAHPTKSNRYQVRYSGGAIVPQLASLGTALAVPANTYAITLNDDGTANLIDTSASPVNFGLVRGDKVYLSGGNFGDVGPWSLMNQGFWTVVSCSVVGVNPGAKLVLRRGDATDLGGVDETVTAVAALDIQKVAKVAAVLLVGAPAYAGVWAVVESAVGWFSIDSTTPLPDLPPQGLTALSLVADQFLGYARVEVDGPVVVSNRSGDLIQGQQALRPVKFSDPLAAPVGGWMEVYGFLTQLNVENVTDVPVNVNVILAYVEG